VKRTAIAGHSNTVGVYVSSSKKAYIYPLFQTGFQLNLRNCAVIGTSEFTLKTIGMMFKPKTVRVGPSDHRGTRADDVREPSQAIKSSVH
jgi:hypothetical protein